MIVRVGNGEDGIEDGGKVDSVDGVCEVCDDNGVRVWEFVVGLLGEVVVFDVIKL